MATSPKASKKGKPRRFNLGLTLTEVNLVDEALRQLRTSAPDMADNAMVLSAKIHRSVAKQMSPAEKPRERHGNADAMFKRLPGSFESARR